jgi:ankyrin repeat protein
VRLLLERRADVDAKADHDGETVLHLAAIGGSETVWHLLIDRGADV